MHIDEVARVCHEANRAVQQIMGEEPNPPWEEAPQWQRISAMDGVRNVWDSEATPEESHENWRRHKEAEGWSWGPEKDPEIMVHPCMVPYDDLPEEQRAKDHVFVAIAGALRSDQRV